MRIGSTTYLDDHIVDELRYEILNSEEWKDNRLDAADEVQHILALCKSAIERRNVRAEVVYFKKLIFVWRIINGEEAWQEFLADLYSSGLGSRDLDAVKKQINDQFILEYDSFKDQRYGLSEVEFTNLNFFHYDPKTKTLTVSFQDSDYASQLRKIS